MTAPPRVIIVADDLTGAMDVAGPLAARGLSTLAVASIDGCMPQHLAGAEVVSINADSRHLPAAAAADRVRAIVRKLIHPEAGILIKKIDSTLRGNVVSETLAMLEASGRRAAVVAPAFPAQGRTVVDGTVFVQGVPLRATNFARDALSPPPLDPIDHLFAQADPNAQVRRVAPGATARIVPGGGRQVFAVDSISDADLRAPVEALRDQLKDALLVGSAGLAEAVAEVCFPRADRMPAIPTVAGRLLFVVGSRAAQSAEQVAALIAAGDAQSIAAPNGSIDVQAASRATAQIVVLKATADAEGREGNAAQVAQGLANGVAQLLERCAFGAMIATGGDTAIAILQRLSQPVLRVMGNVLPGIPFSRIGGGDLWFITKAGGFGGRDTFVAIAQRLRGG
jgi:D-threonate/D-erythronate kinase